MFDAMISICMGWDAYKMHPKISSKCKRSSRKVISCSHSSDSRSWRVCTLGTLWVSVCVCNQKKGMKGRSGMFIFPSVGRSWHTHTQRSAQQQWICDIFRCKWTMEPLVVLGAAVGFAYLSILSCLILKNCDNWTLLNDSAFLSLAYPCAFPLCLSLRSSFPSDSLFAIVCGILKVILPDEIELVDFACWVRKHLVFRKSNLQYFRFFIPSFF